MRAGDEARLSPAFAVGDAPEARRRRAARIARPIGIDGIRGKEPEVIVVAIAAQLLLLRPRSEGRPP
ncbi:hypothetical protein [Thauera sinica]|uniref:XdhC Rossmann domain-containing protein n=1 Tax=Thauera sinica TaxID=2665146 RepID=A0ABW1AQS5_9RHOO|nr:hypothetical protein [Thauera sp. K11]ATE59714.1 hypothetical protein CCZ27_06900 [Thauera sp. K11]